MLLAALGTILRLFLTRQHHHPKILLLFFGSKLLKVAFLVFVQKLHHGVVFIVGFLDGAYVFVQNFLFNLLRIQFPGLIQLIQQFFLGIDPLKQIQDAHALALLILLRLILPVPINCTNRSNLGIASLLVLVAELQVVDFGGTQVERLLLQLLLYPVLQLLQHLLLLLPIQPSLGSTFLFFLSSLPLLLETPGGFRGYFLRITDPICYRLHRLLLLILLANRFNLALQVREIQHLRDVFWLLFHVDGLYLK